MPHDELKVYPMELNFILITSSVQDAGVSILLILFVVCSRGFTFSLSTEKHLRWEMSFQIVQVVNPRGSLTLFSLTP